MESTAVSKGWNAMMDESYLNITMRPAVDFAPWLALHQICMSCGVSCSLQHLWALDYAVFVGALGIHETDLGETDTMAGRASPHSDSALLSLLGSSLGSPSSGPRPFFFWV